MYKIAICDDNKQALEIAGSMVGKVLEEAGEKGFLINCYSSGKLLLEDKDDYHIFILDIKMPDMDGLTLAKEIRQDNPLSVILFLTNYEAYMKESFYVEPFRYLSKPIDEEEFKKAIIKAVEKIKPTSILLKDCHGISHMVDVKTVKYIESVGNFCRFYGVEEGVTFFSSGSLKEWEKRFPNYFTRISRAYIMNLKFVKKMDEKQRKLLLSTGEEIEFSKGRMKQIGDALERCVLEKFRRE
jgi:DNA-binding LytR/AlgR family response regulator